MKLSVEGGVALMVAGQNIPLVHVLTLNRRGLKADKDALLRLVDGDARQPWQAWDPLRGASKPRRPPRTHDTTGLAAAATSEDE